MAEWVTGSVAMSRSKRRTSPSRMPLSKRVRSSFNTPFVRWASCQGEELTTSTYWGVSVSMGSKL